ncbi:Ubiquitin-like-conjugating enzyme ATG10 [Folsomia candida]|uniref:Ubiquitin-like-conjugating enzyme ATG10 n=1 Tax=Folsomia candida TaxID=158441 RepID=A0A226EMU6_FOLCA|nr:Ubiquitin-like-conjugating enzyme ATG10 [Folsomia candida]
MTMQEGRMSYEQFTFACANFIKCPQAQIDSWRLEDESHEFGESFLSLSTIRQTSVPSSGTDADVTVCTVEESDAGKTDNSFNMKLLQYRFDVLYSVSHCVPVLYFTISETSGRLLSLDEVWTLFGLQAETDTSLWNVVSWQDHPVLHMPFLCVHPCSNWAIMKECFQGKEPTCEQFLISWLSFVGNQFGLKLSPAYLLNS